MIRLGAGRSPGESSDHVIVLGARFDLSSHEEFIGTYSAYQPGERVVVDFGATRYIDSSALGLLLLLRDHLGAAQHVTLVNCSGQPDHVLRLSNFHRLFRYGAPDDGATR